MTEHVERWIGAVQNVFHVPGPEIIHSDVLHVSPTRHRPRHTLVTCGMGLRPMCPPIEAKECLFGELFLSLPAAWPVGSGRRTRSAPWVHALGDLARFPHLAETWLWLGHTVGGESADEPIFPRSRYTAWIIGPPMGLEPNASVARIAGRDVHLFSALPIYREERELAMNLGSELLLRLLSMIEVDEMVRTRRPAVVGPRAPRRWR